MQKIEPQHELVVFNKKEIFIVLVLFALVALLSFTLGVRMGRSLADTKLYVEEVGAGHGEVAHSGGNENHIEGAPLTEKKEPLHGEGREESHEGGVAETRDTKTAASGLQSQESENTSHEKTQIEHGTEATSAAGSPIETKKANSLADRALRAELSKSGVHADVPVSMSLPKEKKSEKQNPVAPDKGKFTLQVGSHRTVGEASEQVMELKQKGLDAFYIETSVKGRGTWYRVGIGSFTSKEQAELYAARYKGELPPYIVQKVSE